MTTLSHRRYQAGALLGEGGQGFVLRVVDREAPHRPLVAKVWHAGAFDESVLAGEFALLSRLRIRGLVRAHDFAHDEETGAPFFVEDFVDGVDAAELMGAASDARARNARLLGILADVASTLAGLHDAGFVHGDLKPPHVRIGREGRAVLLDLGAAVSRARASREERATALTRDFAAPEVALGARPTAASDLFGLGALAWSIATGGARRDGRALRELAPWLAPSVADVVTALLVEHPADRPCDARDVLRRLGAAGSAAVAATHAPAPIGRDDELDALLASPAPRVRYLVGPSGAGKSQLAREAATRALLAGREARVVGFPGDDPAIVARLIAFFRGADHAWPMLSTPPSTGALATRDAVPLLVLDDLHAAPGEITAALDAYRCRPRSARANGPDVIATDRTAPDGATSLVLGSLSSVSFAALCRALGEEDDAAIAEAARASGGNPGWLVASRGRVPLSRDLVLERLRPLSRAACEMFAAMAIAGGETDAHVCEEIATPAAISELLAAALVERHRRGDGVVYALSAPSLAGDVASALATFELTDRLAGVLLAHARATPTVLLAVSQSPTPPARREDLLALAAARARASGLRSVEMDALFALAAHVPSRSSALLCRLERLTRDAGTSATHPRVLEWLDEAARSDPTVLPLALRRRAEKAARDGDAKGAASLVSRAREAARASGDVAAEALTLASAGAIALYRADWATADAALAEARARLASIDLHDAEEIARLDHNAGVIALYRGRVDEAVAAFERSLAAKRKIGDRGGMRSCLLNLGLALARADRLDDADCALAEALALARSLGQSAGRAWCLAARADVEIKRRDAPAAERWIVEAEALGDAAPSVVRADLALLRAEVARLEGDGRRSLAAVATIDPSVRAGDAMVDARARVAEASALLAVLPARPRDAARAAIGAVRAARRAMLPEVEALALAVLRSARGNGPARGAARSYSSSVATRDSEHDTAAWLWLEALASGRSLDDAASDLTRMVVRETLAERAFVATVSADGSLVCASGTDLDGLSVAEAERRVDPEIVRAALASSGPVYQRDTETAGGRGSRIGVASPPVSERADAGNGRRAVVVAEHRFHASRFDGVSEHDARRWATLAALLARVHAPESRRPERASIALDTAPRRSAPSPASTAIPLSESRRAFPAILGTSAALRKALARLDAAIDSDLPALIVGETGTGKELFARALHDHGARAGAPFVAVNCGAIPDALFEAELFGHTRGSFTGAERARPGLIARAEGGTLLLDEIGELPLARQASLLRALESRRFRAVGSDEERAFDVRIVAATNRELEDAIEEGTFRRDLLFRINVIEIRVPPLREREGDVALLARAFLDRAGSNAEIAEGALAALDAYAWPGNVRELEHQMQRLAAMRVARVESKHLARQTRESPSRHGSRAPAKRRERGSEDDERAEVERVLSRKGGNITLAAKELGLTRHGLKKRMVRLGLRAAAAPARNGESGSAS